jgi:RNase P/RNase MRP subunit p29
LIGRELYAKSKTDPNWKEFQFIGTVVGETKNTLNVQKIAPINQYIKQNYIFRCWVPQTDNLSKLLEFDGTKVIGNPEQRIKKIRKKTRRRLH